MYLKSFLYLNDTDRSSVPSFDLLFDPESLISFLLGGFLIVWNLFQVFVFVATIYVIPIWRECGVSGLLPVCLLYFCFGAIRILIFFDIIIRLV